MKIFSFIFEVLDKEQSIQSIWIEFLCVAIVGFLLCHLRWQFIAIVLPVALIFSAIMLSELHDPYVGPAIWAESRSYAIQSYAAALTSLLIPYLGALLSWRKRKGYGKISLP